MAKARAIVKRLKAIKNIRKITRTMELIATARFKRAMDRATEAAAYTQKISEIVADLSQAKLQFSHPLLSQRDPVRKAVLLVLTSNRGLCGGYNSGVLRLATRRMAELDQAGIDFDVEVAGKRGISFLRFQNIEPTESYTELGDDPQFETIDGFATRYIEWFIEGRIDRLDVAYTRFVSASRQVAVVETLLPIGELGNETHVASKNAPVEETGKSVDYEFLPSAQEILAELVPAAFKARLFKTFLDAAVSEQIARMVAMKGATENADDMIQSLSQKYNRARQAQITGELAEIIGGVAALE